jgi:hypothetical protein
MELNENGKRKIDTSKFNVDEKSKIEVTEGLKQRTSDSRIDDLEKELKDLKEYIDKPYVEAKREMTFANIKVRMDAALQEFGRLGDGELNNLKKVYVAILDTHAILKALFDTLGKVYLKNIEHLERKVENQHNTIQDLTAKLNKKNGWF